MRLKQLNEILWVAVLRKREIIENRIKNMKLIVMNEKQVVKNLQDQLNEKWYKYKKLEEEYS